MPLVFFKINLLNMKKIFLFLTLCFSFVASHSQICKDTLYHDTSYTSGYDYDTSWLYSQKIISYDTAWKIRHGRMVQLGYREAKNVVKSITPVYGPDSTMILDSTAFKLLVIVDRKDTVCKPLVNSTAWGLKIQNDQFDNQLSIAKQTKVKWIRSNSLGITGFTGDIGNAGKWKDNGFNVLLNVDFIDNPTLKPYNFVQGSDTSIFKTGFENICIAVKKKFYPSSGLYDKPGQDSVILFIGNEPANLGYYNWNPEAYIHELAMAIPIAHKYGLKIADGATHLELIEMIRLGTWQSDDHSMRNKILIDAYKNLDLDYVAAHTSYNIKSRAPYPTNDLSVTINFLRNYTGKDVIMNEYSILGGTTAVVDWFVSGFKIAKVPIACPWSGANGVNGGSPGDAYNFGTVLTPIGERYAYDISLP